MEKQEIGLKSDQKTINRSKDRKVIKPYLAAHRCVLFPKKQKKTIGLVHRPNKDNTIPRPVLSGLSSKAFLGRPKKNPQGAGCWPTIFRISSRRLVRDELHLRIGEGPNVQFALRPYCG